MNQNNPLLSLLEKPVVSIPFNQIEANHFDEAIDVVFKRAFCMIDAIAKNEQPPSFQNTIEAIDAVMDDFELLYQVFSVLVRVQNNDALKQLSHRVDGLYAHLRLKMSQNIDLFNRVKKVWDTQDFLALDKEQEMLLKKQYQTFVRAGVFLEDDQKIRLIEIEKELLVLRMQFANNVITETGERFLVVENEDDLAGFSSDCIKNAKKRALAKGIKQGWLLSASNEVRKQVMKNAHSEQTRRQYYQMRLNRCNQGEYNNIPIIERIVQLRQEKAAIFGFENYAEMVLQDQIAGDVSIVQNLINMIKDGAARMVKPWNRKLKDFVQSKYGVDEIRPWDRLYYTEKFQKDTQGFDDNDVYPYLELENVIRGMHNHFERLYNVSFEENTSYSVYHPDVRAYDVFDKTTQKHMGVYYSDLFSREGEKQSGAWARFITPGKQGKQCPIVLIGCNFEKAPNGQKTLLTLGNVVSLFHEMGHGLHALSAQTRYTTVSSKKVKVDYLELPSLLMEKWVTTKAVLKDIGKHYKTGKGIPDGLIEKIQSSVRAQRASYWLRQMRLTQQDLDYHTSGDIQGKPATTFLHIFSHDYGAKYYFYAWASVLVADAFEYITEHSLYNERGREFRDQILSVGGSVDEMEAFEKFLGRPLDKKALLRQEGLIPNHQKKKTKYKRLDLS